MPRRSAPIRPADVTMGGGGDCEFALDMYMLTDFMHARLAEMRTLATVAAQQHRQQ